MAQNPPPSSLLRQRLSLNPCKAVIAGGVIVFRIDSCLDTLLGRAVVLVVGLSGNTTFSLDTSACTVAVRVLW